MGVCVYSCKDDSFREGDLLVLDAGGGVRPFTDWQDLKPGEELIVRVSAVEYAGRLAPGVVDGLRGGTERAQKATVPLRLGRVRHCEAWFCDFAPAGADADPGVRAADRLRVGFTERPAEWMPTVDHYRDGVHLSSRAATPDDLREVLRALHDAPPKRTPAYAAFRARIRDRLAGAEAPGFPEKISFDSVVKLRPREITFLVNKDGAGRGGAELRVDFAGLDPGDAPTLSFYRRGLPGPACERVATADDLAAIDKALTSGAVLGPHWAFREFVDVRRLVRLAREALAGESAAAAPAAPAEVDVELVPVEGGPLGGGPRVGPSGEGSEVLARFEEVAASLKSAFGRLEEVAAACPRPAPAPATLDRAVEEIHRMVRRLGLNLFDGDRLAGDWPGPLHGRAAEEAPEPKAAAGVRAPVLPAREFLRPSDVRFCVLDPACDRNPYPRLAFRFRDLTSGVDALLGLDAAGDLGLFLFGETRGELSPAYRLTDGDLAAWFARAGKPTGCTLEQLREAGPFNFETVVSKRGRPDDGEWFLVVSEGPWAGWAFIKRGRYWEAEARVSSPTAAGLLNDLANGNALIGLPSEYKS